MTKRIKPNCSKRSGATGAVWSFAWQEWSLRRQCRAQAGTEQSARPLQPCRICGRDLGAPFAGSTPVRRVAARERDIVEVPGLSPKSEAILKAFDQLDSAQKPQFLERITKTPDGQQALVEAGAVANALEKRFGTSNRLELEKMDLRLSKDQVSAGRSHQGPGAAGGTGEYS